MCPVVNVWVWVGTDVIIVVLLSIDSPYDIFACEAFARNGLRPYSSPADQVIADFACRGIGVDQLYCMLADMDAWGSMTVLEDYGEYPRGTD